MWYCFFNSAGSIPEETLLAAARPMLSESPTGWNPHQLSPLTHTYRMGGAMKKWFAWVASIIVVGWWSPARPTRPAHVHPAGLDHRGVQRQHRPRPHQQDERLDHRPCHPAARWSGTARWPGCACRTIRPTPSTPTTTSTTAGPTAPRVRSGTTTRGATRFSGVQLLRLHQGPAVRRRQPVRFPGHHLGERRGATSPGSAPRPLRPGELSS